MPRANLALIAPTALVLFMFLDTGIARKEGKRWTPSSCGTITNISSPFCLKDDSSSCGDHTYELACENNRTTFTTKYGKFYVEEISYEDRKIRLVDESLEKEKCSIPRNSLILDENYPGNFLSFCLDRRYSYIYFLNCKVPINSSIYIDASPCTNSSSSPNPHFFYAILSFEADMKLSDFNESCKVDVQVPHQLGRFLNINSTSIFDIYNELSRGLEVCWQSPSNGLFNSFIYRIIQWWYLIVYEYLHLGIILWNGWFLFGGSEITYYVRRIPMESGKFQDVYRLIRLTSDIITIIALYHIAAFILGAPFVIIFLVYKWRRRHLSMYDTVEEFLQAHNNLMPVRYLYSDIKRITNNFKDKLGEGGYGSVYKGKLRSGRFAAIKILGKSKANGQEFINEVATIGRIHHINVVQLIGFCAEGSKRALVYEFMPNGSLEKYIFYPEGHMTISWERLYGIAVGVARGIEYLHHGCDVQILHFDIKPQNIILDENFTPKVSDFGLAKSYQIDDSVVSLTAPRGTRGYMAPELFYKNIGGVSCKSDVYSFGMLLMEMAGRRKNLDASVEHLSQVYYPSWVYDQFSEGKDIDMGDASEDEKKLAKKIIITAFWCIQMSPDDRPSMKEAVEMLEGDVESLQLPPKPLLLPTRAPEQTRLKAEGYVATVKTNSNEDQLV